MIKSCCFLLCLCGLLFADEVAIPANIEHQSYDHLLKTYVNEKGLVDYAKWKASPKDLKALDEYLHQFEETEGEDAAGDEKIVGLVNLYNAATLKKIFEAYPIESIRWLKDPFSKKSLKVRGKEVSLDEIEHETLRPLIGWKTHAMLVCAARSCPPLSTEAYAADRWEKQMRMRYQTWLAREDLNAIHPDRKRVEISKIFDWYKEDFHDAHSIPNLLLRFGPEKDRAFLTEKEYDIRFLPYHWGLNDQSEVGKDYKQSFFKSLFH